MRFSGMRHSSHDWDFCLPILQTQSHQVLQSLDLSWSFDRLLFNFPASKVEEFGGHYNCDRVTASSNTNTASTAAFVVPEKLHTKRPRVVARPQREAETKVLSKFDNQKDNYIQFDCYCQQAHASNFQLKLKYAEINRSCTTLVEALLGTTRSQYHPIPSNIIQYLATVHCLIAFGCLHASTLKPKTDEASSGEALKHCQAESLVGFDGGRQCGHRGLLHISSN